jgi:hypothetical protein
LKASINVQHLRQKPSVLLASLLATIAVAWAAAHRLPLEQSSIESNPKHRQRQESGAIAQPSQPLITAQVIGPIDRSVIAGGGGNSTGGRFSVDGTIGEVSAAKTQSGGTFTLNGGYWNTPQNPAATPTPTPSPTPTPTPTPTPSPSPTPNPSPLQLLMDESGPFPDQAAALDSLLFLRDPFAVTNSDLLNLGHDQNTRVIVFVMNLQLAPGEPSGSVVVNLIDSNNQSYDLAAEDVRPAPNFVFTQVIFRLPDTLPPGTCLIKVKAHGQISNSGTFRIRI